MTIPEFVKLLNEKANVRSVKALWELMRLFSASIEYAVECVPSHMYFFITNEHYEGQCKYTIRFMGYGGEIGIFSEFMQYFSLESAIGALNCYIGVQNE